MDNRERLEDALIPGFRDMILEKMKSHIKI